MEKKIPTKNYVILFVVIGLTVVLAFYIRDWYIMTKEYYAQNSVIRDVVSEIREDEISNYVLENPRFIMYVSSGKNMEVKDFESSFKSLIEKMEIQNDMLYLNAEGIDMSKFNENLKQDYAGNSTIAKRISNSSQATIYIFDEGKIIGVINNAHKYSNNQLQTLLEGYEM